MGFPAVEVDVGRVFAYRVWTGLTQPGPADRLPSDVGYKTRSVSRGIDLPNGGDSRKYWRLYRPAHRSDRSCEEKGINETTRALEGEALYPAKPAVWTMLASLQSFRIDPQSGLGFSIHFQ